MQRFLQAKAPPAQARPSHRVIAALAEAVGVGTFPVLASDVFATIASTVPEFAQLTYRTVGLKGECVSVTAEMTA